MTKQNKSNVVNLRVAREQLKTKKILKHNKQAAQIGLVNRLVLKIAAFFRKKTKKAKLKQVK